MPREMGGNTFARKLPAKCGPFGRAIREKILYATVNQRKSSIAEPSFVF